MMQAFEEFSKATGLKVNHAKCIFFYGNMDIDEKKRIQETTKFIEGSLPFKYLGISLTIRKLNISHYMPLIEKIMSRINHWSSRLLSFAGRSQLIKSVPFSLTNYRLQCFPLPKKVIKKIEAICRTFLWSDTDQISRKSPITWKEVCSPNRQGGRNIIDIERWNKAILTKLL